MVRRYNRLLVAFYVITDALLAAWAYLLAVGNRFDSGRIRRHAESFSRERHVARLRAVIDETLSTVAGDGRW